MLTIALSMGGSARAQSAQDREQARALHAEGRAAAAEEAWARSIERFRASLALVPRSTTAFSLAEVLDRSGDPLAAHALLSDLLNGTYGDLPEAALRRVRPLAQGVRRRIARLSVLTSADALHIDGELHAVQDGSVGAWLLPGEHRIELAGETRTVVLTEGDEQVVDLNIDPPSTGALSEDARAHRSDPSDVRRVRRRRRALIISSALVVLGAAAFSAWYLARPDEDPVWGRANALVTW